MYKNILLFLILTALLILTYFLVESPIHKNEEKSFFASFLSDPHTFEYAKSFNLNFQEKIIREDLKQEFFQILSHLIFIKKIETNELDYFFKDHKYKFFLNNEEYILGQPSVDYKYAFIYQPRINQIAQVSLEFTTIHISQSEREIYMKRYERLIEFIQSESDFWVK